MTDVVLVAVIVAFFVAAAFLVGALGRVIAGSGDDAGYEEASGPEPEPGRRA